MGWSVGYDTNWKRDIGYGVPSMCDHAGCTEQIDRGLAYVCDGQPYGGSKGCGLYFCAKHMLIGDPQLCNRCDLGDDPFNATPDLPIWINHKATDPSWAEWRDEQKKQSTKKRKN